MSPDDRRDQSPQQSDEQPQMGEVNQRRPVQSESLLDRLLSDVSFEKAVIVGLLAAVVVYGLAAALAEADPGLGDDDGESIELQEEPSWVDSRGWLFFSTHFVETKIDATSTGNRGFTTTADLLEQENDAYPTVLYRAIPPAVLVLAGFGLASRYLDRRATAQDGARVGALVAAGYLPATFAGVLLFSFQTQYQAFSLTYAVPMGSAVLLAGVVYPVIFGAIGGYLTQR